MLKVTSILVTLTGCLGALLPGDAGYQYDRPGFGGDFGRRTNDLAARYPNRLGYGAAPGFNNGLGFARPGLGYQGGYNGYNGYNGNNGGYNGRYGYNDGGYRGAYDDGSGRPAQPYNFQYDVRDPVTGTNFGQQEAGDANGSKRGEYRVLLPDSRTQVVRYTADDANGYVADVSYEGQAQYPVGRPGAFLPGALPGTGLAGNYYNNPNFAYRGRGAYPGVGGIGPNGAVVGADGYGYAGGLANQYLPPNAPGTFGK